MCNFSPSTLATPAAPTGMQSPVGPSFLAAPNATVALAVTVVGPVTLTLTRSGALYTYDLAYANTVEQGDLYDTLGETTDAAHEDLTDLFESWKAEVPESIATAREIAGRY